jgi:hypothetical protein
MGDPQSDGRLRRWYTSPELALLWGCSPNTARARLRALNRQRGGRLVEERPGMKRSHLRVWGGVLEEAFPGSLTRRAPEGLREIRQLRAELDELRAQVDLNDEWRDQFSKARTA